MDVSLTGLVFCSLAMFMGLAAINTQANLLFGVFGLMIGIGCISYWISGVVLRKLELDRKLPEHGTVGEPTRFGDLALRLWRPLLAAEVLA